MRFCQDAQSFVQILHGVGFVSTRFLKWLRVVFCIAYQEACTLPTSVRNQDFWITNLPAGSFPEVYSPCFLP